MKKWPARLFVLIAIIFSFAIVTALAACGDSGIPTTTAGGPTTSSGPTTSEQNGTSLPSTTTTLGQILPGVDTVRYEDEKLGFSIGRPASSPVLTKGFEQYLPLTQTPVIGFTLTPELFQGTNLIDAGVYIGASADKAIVDKWDQPVADSGEESVAKTKINGLEFAVFTSTGAAAGNIYDQKVYRVVNDGTCFEIVELLHSGNIANYEKGKAVEFDKAEFQGYLEAMVQTFSF
ncbi:MAG: hypothetical protein M1274_00130 [Actinobacteria bacterium]|nr:hypothetical protein [Actinomycetota bacterium]